MKSPLPSLGLFLDVDISIFEPWKSLLRPRNDDDDEDIDGDHDDHDPDDDRGNPYWPGSPQLSPSLRTSFVQREAMSCFLHTKLVRGDGLYWCDPGQQGLPIGKWHTKSFSLDPVPSVQNLCAEMDFLDVTLASKDCLLAKGTQSQSLLTQSLKKGIKGEHSHGSNQSSDILRSGAIF